MFKFSKCVFCVLCIVLLVGILTSCAVPGDAQNIQPESTPSPPSSLAPPLAAQDPDPVPASEPEPEPQPVEQRVRFSASGDNLIHEAIYRSAQANSGGEEYDFTYCYENVSYFFKDFDVNWLNQETLVTDTLEPATYPCFSTPGQLGRDAYAAGFRVFAMSNNHSYDKLETGVSATLDYWGKMPKDVVYYGLYTDTADESGIALQEVNGITIAYVAFTDGTNGINISSGSEAEIIYTSNETAAKNKISAAREMADVVVVSVHWGVENSHNISANQRYQAQNYANWGADIVIGTHPHVVQDMEWIESEEDGRPVFVAYSLGNFLSAQSKPNQLIGITLTFDFVRTIQPNGDESTVTIENIKAVPTVTQYEYDGGAFYLNPRVYLLRDYTDELAQKHRVKSKEEANWGIDYILNVLKTNISEEYLTFD